jgi:hypothetical protein
MLGMYDDIVQASSRALGRLSFMATTAAIPLLMYFNLLFQVRAVTTL